jgi:hypothetical protein
VFCSDRLETGGDRDREGVQVGQAKAGIEPLTVGTEKCQNNLEFYPFNHTPCEDLNTSGDKCLYD